MLKTALRNFLLRQFQKRGYSIRFGASALDFEALVTQLASHNSEIFFVQIGGFDGISDDPIHQFVVDYKWSGLIVEPQPAYFQKLQQTYAGYPQARPINALIGETAGTTTFYTVSTELPIDYHGQASFDKQLILHHLQKLPDPEKYIIEQQLPAIPLSQLLQTNSVNRIDLLQVDTEGFDYDILKQFDFQKYSPSLIHFEHIHLKPEKLKAAINLLLNHRYQLHLDQMDITAYR